MKECVSCKREIFETEVLYAVNERNFKLYSNFFPNLKEGYICCSCYGKWKTKTSKDPRMCLTKLFCGICKKEEPDIEFSENFQKINGNNIFSVIKKTNKKVIMGPVCLK